MIEIKFGKEETANPTGSFEKFGTSDKILTGKFLEFMEIQGKTYLFAEVLEAFPSADLETGDIYIKEALTDTFENNNLILFLNEGNKDFCKQLSQELNARKAELIINEISLKELLCGENANPTFELIAKANPIVTTEINETIFNKKRKQAALAQNKQKKLIKK